MGYIVGIGLISSYFSTYYNVAANIITTALPAAIMVSAPLTQLFIDIYGWRGTLLLFSGLNLHYIAAAASLKPTNQIQTDIKGISYKPLTNESDDIEGSKCGNMFSICFEAMCNVALFANGRFVVVLVASIVSGYTFNGWVVYLISIGQSKGLSPSDAANVATLSGVGSILIRIILATLKDKTSYRHLFLIGSVLGIISYGGMCFVNSILLLSLSSIVLGVSYGILGTQVYIGANAVVEKDTVVGAIAWIGLTFGFGYITSGYVSGKFHFIHVRVSCILGKKIVNVLFLSDLFTDISSQTNVITEYMLR